MNYGCLVPYERDGMTPEQWWEMWAEVKGYRPIGIPKIEHLVTVYDSPWQYRVSGEVDIAP